MAVQKKITVESFERDVSTDELLSRFFDESVSSELCKSCGNYGAKWSCPPFETPPEYRKFAAVRLMLRRVAATGSIEDAYDSERAGFDAEILAAESSLGGMGMYAGSCIICGKCVRVCGVACLHPDKMRTSLEAVGFDVSKIVREIFGVGIEWGSDPRKPRFATLLGAVFYGDRGV